MEFGVRQGRQMFVISWRNPDSRHASWNFDTYVRAVLDALDAVEEVTGSSQTVLGGVCSEASSQAWQRLPRRHRPRDRLARSLWR